MKRAGKCWPWLLAVLLVAAGVLTWRQMSDAAQEDETPYSPVQTQPADTSRPAGSFWHSNELPLLVNRWNPVHERCYMDTLFLLDALYAQRLKPEICSAYRTEDEQQRIYNETLNGYISKGYSAQQAQELTELEVALPGSSEHHLGLALDIVDWLNPQMEVGQEETELQLWLKENSWRYGFILRYPADKTALTGIVYEPWHYRYVGRTYAQQIYESGLCLEEWLAQQS